MCISVCGQFRMAFTNFFLQENINFQDQSQQLIILEKANEDIDCSSQSDLYVSASSVLSSCSSLEEHPSEISLCESSDDCIVAKTRNVCGVELSDSKSTCICHLDNTTLTFDDLLCSPVVKKHTDNQQPSHLSVDVALSSPVGRQTETQLLTNQFPELGYQVITKYADSIQQTIDDYHNIIKPNSPQTFPYIKKQ